MYSVSKAAKIFEHYLESVRPVYKGKKLDLKPKVICWDLRAVALVAENLLKKLTKCISLKLRRHLTIRSFICK